MESRASYAGSPPTVAALHKDCGTRGEIMTDTFTNLVHSSLKEFGRLLREVCEVGGYTLEKLSREACHERERLIVSGDLKPHDPVGPMGQLAIARVMAGFEEPTCYQVYIWLRVLRTHFESPEFAQICQDLGIPLPTFPPALEAELWRLSNHQAPSELREAYEWGKDVRLIIIGEVES